MNVSWAFVVNPLSPAHPNHTAVQTGTSLRMTGVLHDTQKATSGPSLRLCPPLTAIDIAVNPCYPILDF